MHRCLTVQDYIKERQHLNYIYKWSSKINCVNFYRYFNSKRISPFKYLSVFSYQKVLRVAKSCISIFVAICIYLVIFKALLNYLTKCYCEFIKIHIFSCETFERMNSYVIIHKRITNKE